MKKKYSGLVLALMLSSVSINSFAANPTQVRQPTTAEMKSAGCDPQIFNQLVANWQNKRNAERSRESQGVNNEILQTTPGCNNSYSSMDNSLSIYKAATSTGTGSMYDMMASMILQMLKSSACEKVNF